MGWVFRFGAGPDPQTFFDTYGMEGRSPITYNSVIIASAYGARTKRKWLIKTSVMRTAFAFYGDAESPSEERKGFEEALGYLEKEFSYDLGINDRRSLDWRGSGDPAQMDCVDEAWNATVLLLFLNRYGKTFKYHEVIEPMCKQPLWKWTHYGATILDNADVKWIVDGGVRRGGLPPQIFHHNDWYE